MLSKTSEILGTTVRDRRGGPVGEIVDVVVEPLTGRLAYAIVAVAPATPSSHDLLPVPWSVLGHLSGAGEYELPLLAASVAKAPGFSRERWPDLDDRSWGVRVCAFYGAQPYWERRPEPGEAPRPVAAGTEAVAAGPRSARWRDDGSEGGTVTNEVRVADA